MTNQDQSWIRSRFQKSPLSFFVSFVVFGEIQDVLPPLSQETYGIDKLPDQLSMEIADRSKSDYWDRFFAGSGWDDFQKQHSNLTKPLQDSSVCVMIRGEHEDDEDLRFVGDSIKVIMALLDHGGIACYDLLTGTWWTALRWRTMLYEAGAAGLANLVTLAVDSLQEAGDDYLHVCSQGMRRFARPDIAIDLSRFEGEHDVESIAQFLIGAMIDGTWIPNGQKLNFPEHNISFNAHLHGDLQDEHFYNFYLSIS